jgi:cell division protein FtsL
MDSDPTAPDRAWKNRTLVREPDVHRMRRMWGTLLGIVLAIAPAGLYLLQQHECLKRTIAVNRLRAEHDRLLEEKRRLQVERATLQSLNGIERWASTDRGLVRPSSDRVVVVESSLPPRDLVARVPGSEVDPSR